ncbi:hypothetical protein CHS0354_037978 [Potamilus streckersoni]|uniref:Protein prenyltransferase alpha subunit repeat-containing protein 1 n=1 Tax=Potamilus streckersoni TaxID=2493646 RepID=A0AAE0WAJ0_9BIVA|nr:hypothetical protein CHS0354_037978 [Potamilus streckersoni]
MASDKRGARLLSDLSNVFRKDPDIDEYDFLPVLEPKQNKSPIILVDHKLGLETWSVKVLYQYAYHTVLNWRNKGHPVQFLEPIELINLSRAVLLVNPECSTAWNIRKELIEADDITVLEELKFGALILSKHPKSAEAFSHRKWVLGKFLDSFLSSSHDSTTSNGSACSYEQGLVSMEAIDLSVEFVGGMPVVQHGVENGHQDLKLQPVSEYQAQMKAELRVCEKAAEKYPCNYYAWSHRIWVIQHCHNFCIQLLLGELQKTEGWVSKHVSDHSGFHYRQFLLSTLQRQAECLHNQFKLLYQNLLLKEHQFIVDLIHTYPGHEALWSHRKFVFHISYQVFSPEIGTVSTITMKDRGDHPEKPVESTKVSKKTRLENDHDVLKVKEVDSVTKKDLKSSNLYQRHLAKRYLEWMEKISFEYSR